jgi:Putative adhesin
MPHFDTPKPISVTFELGVCDLQIAASDRLDTLVDVQPSNPDKPADVAAAANTTVDFDDGTLVIKSPKGWKCHTFRGSDESIDVRLELPSGSKIRGDAGLATLRSWGRLGDCRYKAGAGDILVEEVTEVTELNTGMGSVRVERAGDSTVIKNGNGDTWIGQAAGDLQVKTANGEVTVEHAGAGVTAKSANGDIHLNAVSRGTVVAETACGAVEVAVQDGVAAWLDLHTGFGHVQNYLEAGSDPGPTGDVVEVRVRSSFGDVTIRRAAAGGGADEG